MRLRLLGILLLAATALSASAQFRYGPIAGANFSNVKFKQELVSSNMQIGPTAGLQCEFIFTSFGLGIDFGLGYSMTGAKINLDERPIWGLQGFGQPRALIHNLQIPIHLRFKWTKMQGFEEILAPFCYAGPDFNIQVGHSRVRANGNDAFKFSGGDVAIGCGLGVELLKQWQISAGYSWGLTYALKTRLLEDYSARCSGWHLRLAYLF